MTWKICMICSWYTIVPYVSFRIGSNLGCAYVIAWRPCFLSTKSSTMPDPKGPGLNSATKAPKSSNTSGFNFFTKLVIPEDSSWNTPTVSPRTNISYVGLSSRGIWLISTSIPWHFFTSLTVLWIIVRLRRPKKSIFRSFIFSKISLWYCVIMIPSFEGCTGTIWSSGLYEIITPAACIPIPHLIPSTFLAVSITLFISSSVS